MRKALSVSILVLTLTASTFKIFASTKSQGTSAQSAVPQLSLPSEEEITDLLNKAHEYVETYRSTFRNAKGSLTKAPTPGFLEKGLELSSQADDAIAAIKKNGPSAYALVGLISILDDMTLNATRASGVTMIVAVEENAANPKDRAMGDFQELAQAGKNCYDISELLLHTTLRLINAEEHVLNTCLQH